MRKQYHVSLTLEQRADATAGCWTAGPRRSLTARHATHSCWAGAAVRRRVRGDRQVAELCGVSARTVARVRERFAHSFAVALRGDPPRRGSQALANQEARLIAAGLHRAAGGRAPAGVCGCWPRGRCAAGPAPGQSRTGADHARKNRLRAVAQPTLADSTQAPRRLRGGHGGCAGCPMPVPSIPRAHWSVSTKPARISRPTPPTPAGRAGTGGALRQPRRACRQPQSVAGLCALSRLAPHCRSPSAAPPATLPTPCARSVDQAFPAAARIVLVLDHLNTHTPAALYQAFPAADAWRILERLEWHYTPTHGSWLNMPELEWSVLARQGLARRIPTNSRWRPRWPPGCSSAMPSVLTTSWHFTKEAARTRLSWLNPCHA